MNTDIKNLKREFLEHLEVEKGRSLKTIENYDRYLSKFIFFAKISQTSEITSEIVRNFRMWLNRQPKNKKSRETLSRKTQNYYLIALRAFLKYLRKREIESLQPEQVELAKTTEKSLELITAEELERLMSSSEGELIEELRNKAILEMLFSTGLRVSELCNLNSDINLKNDEMSVRGKGGKIRVVFLSNRAKEALKKYLSKRTDMNEALFIGLNKTRTKEEKTTRLTPRSIERIIKKCSIKAGLANRVTPHTLRHVYATDLLQNGADIRSVQSLLGHASISTTQIYTHVTDSHLKEIHKTFHGKKRKT